MSLVQSLGSIALILLGIWLVMWAVREVFQVKHPIWSGIMVLCAVLAGIGLFISH